MTQKLDDLDKVITYFDNLAAHCEAIMNERHTISKGQLLRAIMEIQGSAEKGSLLLRCERGDTTDGFIPHN